MAKINLGHPKTREITVICEEPTGSTSKKHEFKAEFTVYSPKAWEELIKSRTVVETLEETLTQVTGIDDFEYNEEGKEQLLSIAWLVTGLWNACVAVQNGITDLRYREALKKT